MRRRRLLVGLALGVAVLLAVAVGGVAWLALASLPDYDGRQRLAGLDGPVRIVRDGHAIPRIEATTERDAYLALGFVHAQDRLWQLELHRRTGQGRLAEIVGAAALPLDRFMRTLGLYRRAEASEAHLSDEGRELLAAYSRGVNGFLETRSGPLPPEFQILRHTPEPWRIADSLVFARLMALDLSGNWRDELLRARLATRLTPERLADLWPDQPPGFPVTLQAESALPNEPGLTPMLDRLAAAAPDPVLAGLGSNVVVVSGAHTATGAPMLASDPHLGLRAPGIWYLAHLEAPGLSVVGGTIPAMPVVVIGRNADIAWGMTTTGGDTQDLFIERLAGDDPGAYLTPEGRLPLATRRERILVRDGAAEEVLVRETRHGPVLSDLGGETSALADERHVVALAWTALAEDDVTMEAGFRLARATDWEGFRSALRLMGAPLQNVAFADRRGNIGFLTPGRVPVRKRGDGTLPVAGWTGDHDWLGLVPFDELPQALNPPSGRFVNANNRLVEAGYPHLITRHWDTALRARRIEELLAGRERVALDALGGIQLDIVSTLARDFLPLLLPVEPPEEPLDEEEAALLDALAGWNGTMAPERPEPLLFWAWYHALAPRLYGDELGPLFEAYRGVRSDFLRLVLTERREWCDDVRTPALESCGRQTALALRDALAALRARHGTDWRSWRWGDAHPATMSHRPLDGVPLLGRLFNVVVPVGGDSSTVNVAHGPVPGDGVSFPVLHAAGFRMLADLGEPLAGLFVAATGQSGHPLSDHYDDLTRLWQAGAYVAMRRGDDNPASDARSTLTLEP